MPEFNVGDRVEVFPGAREADMWCDEYSIRTGTILFINSRYAQVLYDNGESWWTESCCLKHCAGLSKEQKIRNKINKLYKMCPSTKHWSVENV